MCLCVAYCVRLYGLPVVIVLFVCVCVCARFVCNVCMLCVMYCAMMFGSLLLLCYGLCAFKAWLCDACDVLWCWMVCCCVCSFVFACVVVV